MHDLYSRNNKNNKNNKAIVKSGIIDITLFDIDKFSYNLGKGIKNSIATYSNKRIKLVNENINESSCHDINKVFYNKKYDTISCHFGIHYINEVSYTKILASLKMGGKFIITFLNGDKLFSLFKKKYVDLNIYDRNDNKIYMHNHNNNIYNDDIKFNNGIIISITEKDLNTNDEEVILNPTSYEIFIPSIGIWMNEKIIMSSYLINLMSNYGLEKINKIENENIIRNIIPVISKDNIDFLNLYDTYIFEKKHKNIYPFMKKNIHSPYGINMICTDVFYNILECLENIEIRICCQVSKTFKKRCDNFLKLELNYKYIYDYQSNSDDYDSGYNS